MARGSRSPDLHRGNVCRRELNPLSLGPAIDIAANFWQGCPPLLGPGPSDYDDFDLSYLEDPDEHWARSRMMPHPDHRDAQMEPGLRLYDSGFAA